MKEILYIQAGTLANYTGTHFWNTQEAYFSQKDDGSNEVVHERSFHEGKVKGESTPCPRLLAFDRKENFGTLSQANALTGIAEEAGAASLWAGNVLEVKQDTIAKSEYQVRMDEEDQSNDKEPTEAQDLRDSTVRYWSDFNRVYYDPRTVQKLPDLADWENADENWYTGKETFSKFNEEASLIEEPARQLLEECDSIQGMQILHDTTTFGAFVDSFLTAFQDDFAKLPTLAFPVLSPEPVKVPTEKGLRQIVNDAMCLRGLNEMASITVPLQQPSAWNVVGMRDELLFDAKSVYQTSAILSSQVESSTLPLRSRGNEDIAKLSSQLNWRGTTRFAHLSGRTPITSKEQVEGPQYDFSVRLETDAKRKKAKEEVQYARLDVTRGFSSASVSHYEQWTVGGKLRSPYLSSTHLGAYPLPTSFPSIFRREGVLKPVPAPSSAPHSVPTFSSLTNSSASVKMFTGYAKQIQECVRRRMDVGGGLDLDELKDLGNDLWSMVDNYVDGQASDSEGDEGDGEDEE